MRIGIIAGEASGDLLGAELIKDLRARYPDLEIEGIGGSAMIAAGCKSLFDIERLSVMGFIEPLRRLPDLLKLRQAICQHFIKHPPELFIGIDAPDFNLSIEKRLRDAGIKTVHYVSPSVWAWRKYRIKKIVRAANLLLTILPFEKEVYASHPIDVHYVGHPLAAQIPFEPDISAARTRLGLDDHHTYVALLPGSRQQELHHLAEPFLRAAHMLWQKHPQIKFLSSHINLTHKTRFTALQKKLFPQLPLQTFIHQSRDVLAAANIVLVAAGTATLETMLFKKPMVIVYKMRPLTYLLAKILVKVPYVGLPNLLAKQMLVPELIQEAATPENIAQHMSYYLECPSEVQFLLKYFQFMHKSLQLGQNCSRFEPIIKLISA